VVRREHSLLDTLGLTAFNFICLCSLGGLLGLLPVSVCDVLVTTVQDLPGHHLGVIIHINHFLLTDTLFEIFVYLFGVRQGCICHSVVVKGFHAATVDRSVGGPVGLIKHSIHAIGAQLLLSFVEGIHVLLVVVSFFKHRFMFPISTAAEQNSSSVFIKLNGFVFLVASAEY
jgi:hypothetical protein